MTLETFWQELLRGGLTLGAGCLVAWLGMYFYFRQKEHEIVKQRYLEQSVDLIAAEFESVSRSFSRNWGRALDVLKLYRDLPSESFDPAELKSGFLDLNAFEFQRVAHHRLTNLIRSNLIWDVFQLAIAKHKAFNSIAVMEVPQGIRLHHAGMMDLSHGEFVKEATELLKPLSDESDRFALLLSTLQVIATELEQSPLRFKDIAQFHERKPVMDALERLKQEFADDFG
jgi:hypothetical protein